MAKLFNIGNGLKHRRIKIVDGNPSPGRFVLQADASHPNKLKFRGILVRLDEPSTKPPQGSQGHLIQVPTDSAQQRLTTLIGMGVNYAENLDAHDPAFKVGVIEKAWIKGNALWVSGYVWVGDFPDAEKVLSTPGMGMSMELTHVLVEDRAAEVWILEDFVFTGATFLRKTNAAYRDTEAIAAAADASTTITLNTEAAMPKTNTQTRAGRSNKPAKPTLSVQEQEVAKVAAAAASASITRALGTPLASIAAALEKSNTVNAAILERLEAADDMDEDEMDGEGDETVDAAGNKGKAKPATGDGETEDDFDEDDDSEDDDDAGEDGDDEDDVDSEADPLLDGGESGDDPDAGDANDVAHQNENAKDRGNKTDLEDKQGPMKAAKAKAAKWKTKALKFAALNKQLRAEVAQLRAGKAASGERVAATAREITRKTLSAASLGLLSKNGLDAADIKASGQQLDADEVDAMFRNLPHALEPEDRLAIKMELRANGLMKGSTPTTVRRTK
jgi:hypothetical protein